MRSRVHANLALIALRFGVISSVANLVQVLINPRPCYSPRCDDLNCRLLARLLTGYRHFLH